MLLSQPAGVGDFSIGRAGFCRACAWVYILGTPSELMLQLLESIRRCALPMNRSGWLTVLGSFLAATTSSGVILTMTFSVFVKPIGDEFGWPRAFVSLGYTAALISIALFLPVTGRLFDRFGVRSVLLWFVMLFSLSIVFLSITPNVPVIFVAL